MVDNVILYSNIQMNNVFGNQKTTSRLRDEVKQTIKALQLKVNKYYILLVCSILCNEKNGRLG